MRFSAKIASRFPYLLIELFYIGLPVVWTDSRVGGRAGGRAYGHGARSTAPTPNPRATEEHLRALSGHVLPGDRAPNPGDTLGLFTSTWFLIRNPHSFYFSAKSTKFGSFKKRLRKKIKIFKIIAEIPMISVSLKKQQFGVCT